jgi:cell division protein FtsW
MLRPGQVIGLCVLALLTVGVVMVNSAGMGVDRGEALTPASILLSRSTIYMGLAIAAMVAAALLPLNRLVPASLRGSAGGTLEPEMSRPRLLSGDWWRHCVRVYVRLWPLWAAVAALLVVLAMVYMPGIARPRNGAHRWINLRIPGLESMQPSEIAKWGLVVVIAVYAAVNASRLGRFWTGLVPGLIAAGAVAGFIVLEDLGTGALIGLVAVIVLVAAGAKIWHVLALMPVPLAIVTLAIVTSEYRQDRVMAFIDPYREPQTIGYHMIQSMVAVANGEVFGRGLGHGLQKFDYLPEDTTDFLFAVICEELGVMGATLVVSLYLGLLWASWMVIRRETSPVLKLVGLGVVATVGFQAVINLAVVTGLGPTKGIALPLLSSGGTGWILTAGSLGLLIAMDRTQAHRALDAAGESDEGDEPSEAPAEVGDGGGAAAAAPLAGAASVNERAVEMALAQGDEGSARPRRSVEELTPSLFAPADTQGDATASDAGGTPAPEIVVTPEGRDWAGPTVRPA